MNASRVAVISVLVVGALLIAVVVLGGSDARQYELVFQNAGQIVKGDDVKIGGRPVGKVKKIELTGNNAAESHGHRRRAVRAASRGGRRRSCRPVVVPLRRREPLRRAHAGADTPPSSMTGRRSTRTRPRRSSTSTRSWQRSTHRRGPASTRSSRASATGTRVRAWRPTSPRSASPPRSTRRASSQSVSATTSWRSTASSRTPRRS